MFVWLLALSSAFADCPEGPVKPEALRATLTEASEAAQKNLGGSLASAFKSATTQIACLDTVLEAKDVELLLAVAAAKSALVDKDPATAAATLRELQRMGHDLAKDPLTKALGAAAPVDPAPATVPVRAPDRAILTMNGARAATSRTLDAWTFVQAKRIDDGLIRVSALVPPKGPMPPMFPPPVGEDPGAFLATVGKAHVDPTPMRIEAAKAWPDVEKAALGGKLDGLKAYAEKFAAVDLPVVGQARAWAAAGEAWTKARAEAATAWKDTAAKLGKGAEADRATLDAFLLAWTNKKVGGAVFVAPEVTEAWKKLAALPPEPPRHWQVRSADVRRVDSGTYKRGEATITMTRAFAVLEGPVSRGWWASVTGDAAPGQTGQDRDPVRGITWLDAVAFANEASEKDGYKPAYDMAGGMVTIIPGADGWRLPTEAEWQYAKKRGAIVAGAPEWLYDEFSEPSGDATDPTGPAGGKSKKALRVIASATDRKAEKPTTKAEGVSFRLVRTIPAN